MAGETQKRNGEETANWKAVFAPYGRPNMKSDAGTTEADNRERRANQITDGTQHTLRLKLDLFGDENENTCSIRLANGASSVLFLKLL